VARAKVEGVLALRRRVEQLASLADNAARTQAANQAQAVVNESAAFARDAIRTSASVRSWPNRLIKAIFKSGDVAEGNLPRRLRAALVGARKGAPPHYDSQLYVGWKARGDNTSPRKKRGAGAEIGMSLMTMWEYGTTKMQARPAFRETYKAIKPMLRERMIQGYKRIIEGFSK